MGAVLVRPIVPDHALFVDQEQMWHVHVALSGSGIEIGDRHLPLSQTIGTVILLVATYFVMVS